MAPGQVHGTGQGALLVLVGLPDVEERHAAAPPAGPGRRPAPPRGWTPWPRSAGLWEWPLSNLRVAPAGRRRLASKGKTLPAGSTFPRAIRRASPDRPSPAPGWKTATRGADEAIRRRRHGPELLRRAARSAPWSDRILDAALRSPTAGNTQGTAWVVLEGPEETADYWDATTDERLAGAGTSSGPTAWPGRPSSSWPMRRPRPTSPATPSRTRQTSGLGDGRPTWPVPYWFGDAAFGVMTVLLGAVDAGLGACVLGAFRGEAALATRLGVPAGWRLFGAVVLGRARRQGPPLAPRSTGRATAPAERIHRRPVVRGPSAGPPRLSSSTARAPGLPANAPWPTADRTAD